MISLKDLSRKKVGVLGFGHTGKATVDALIRANVQVFLHDDNTIKDVEYQKFSADLTDENFTKNLDLIVMSPGIHLFWPFPHKVVFYARKYGIELINDLDLFQKELLSRDKKSAKPQFPKIIAITGTNGKSTTTALIHHIIKSAVQNCCIGGNFGPAILSLPDNSSCYVLELSSYQLEHANILGFDTAILLNITPDHLTRHGGMNGYIAAKQKIFVNAKNSIIGIDDDYCKEIYAFLRSINQPKLVPISGKNIPDFGVGWDADVLVDNRCGDAKIVCPKHPKLDGNHNRQNIAAAYAACCSVDNADISSENFAQNLASFECLEHRQEFVANICGVPYVNDSKATNADAVEQALMRFDNIFWILGGRPKEGGIFSLKQYFSKIKHAFLIGEAAEDWYDFLLSYGVKSEITFNLENAVKRSYEELKRASPKSVEVVLLSPACASFDQFKSFEERGEKFKQLVRDLADKNENSYGI